MGSSKHRRAVAATGSASVASPAKPRPITPPYYPIIYVRGYAATMREIEGTVGTPYMGFNPGSTKIRRRHADDKPVRFIFESPLIRLMKDEGYIDAYRDGDFVNADKRRRLPLGLDLPLLRAGLGVVWRRKRGDPIESYAEDSPRLHPSHPQAGVPGRRSGAREVQGLPCGALHGRADLSHVPAESGVRQGAPRGQGLHVRHAARRHRDDGPECARTWVH